MYPESVSPRMDKERMTRRLETKQKKNKEIKMHNGSSLQFFSEGVQGEKQKDAGSLERFSFFFKTLLAGSQLLAGGIVCVGVFSFFLYGVPPLKSERVSIRDMFRLHSRKVLWREPIKVFRLC